MWGRTVRAYGTRLRLVTRETTCTRGTHRPRKCVAVNYPPPFTGLIRCCGVACPNQAWCSSHSRRCSASGGGITWWPRARGQSASLGVARALGSRRRGAVGGAATCKAVPDFPPRSLARSRLTPPPPVSSHMAPRLAARVRGSKEAARPRAESSERRRARCVARESCAAERAASHGFAPLGTARHRSTPLSEGLVLVVGRASKGRLATRAPQRGEPTPSPPRGPVAPWRSPRLARASQAAQALAGTGMAGQERPACRGVLTGRQAYGGEGSQARPGGWVRVSRLFAAGGECREEDERAAGTRLSDAVGDAARELAQVQHVSREHDVRRGQRLRGACQVKVARLIRVSSPD
jgi:hypothetical protein